MTNTTIKRKTKIIKRKFIAALDALIDEFEKEKQNILLPIFCFLSIFSKFNDINLPFLPILFLLIATKKIEKIACFAIITFCFAVISIKTAFYIPYIAFATLYIIADTLLAGDKKAKPVYAAILAFTISKLYVLSFGYQSVYWIIFICEIVGFVLLPDIIKDGIEVIKQAGSCKDAPQLFCACIALLFISCAIGGVHIWGINPSAAFLLCLALSYAEKQIPDLSLLSMLCMFFYLSQSQNFALLFAGFLSIYLVGVYLSKKSWYGYLSLCVFSFGISMIFLVKFNSFIFITTTAISLLGYFFIDKLKLLKPKEALQSEMSVGEKDYSMLMLKLEKLNKSFRFLGNTVIDISSLLLKEEIPEEMEAIACKQVCKTCSNNVYCWQQHFDDTQRQFTAFARKLQSNAPAVFDDWFLRLCPYTDNLKESFFTANRLLSTKQLIAAAGKQSQKMLQAQFLKMSEALKEITNESYKKGIVNTAFTHAIKNLIEGTGKNISYCLCYQNPNKLVINSYDEFSERDIYKICLKMESMYASRFKAPNVTQDNNMFVYVFCETPMYSFDFDIKSKGKQAICGDTCEILETEKYVYILLSDGMGTGNFAAAESKLTVSMLKSLLSAEVLPATALDIVNIALNLKGTGQSCVTVDILQVDLYSGKSNIIKAGAAASLLFKTGQAEIINKESLPIGILKDTKTSQSELVLSNSDTLLLLSDGVVLTNSHLQKLKLIGSQYSAQDISDYIVDNCVEKDDGTVAAFKLLRT